MHHLEKKRIFKNISWLSFSRILVYLLSIITITIVPRYLGVEKYGQLNFVLSFLGLFYILTDLGLNTLILRDVSKTPSKLKEYFSNFFLFKLFLVLIVSLIIFVFVFFLKKPLVINQLFYLLIPFILFSVFKDFYISFYNALQKNKYFALTELAFKFFYILFLFLVIYFDLNVIGVLLSQVLATLFVLIPLIFLFSKVYKNLSFKLNFLYIKQKVLISWPFALSTLFYTIYFNFDKIFISLIKGDVWVGLYAMGYTFLSFVISLISLISLAFFPVLSKHSSSKIYSKIYNKFYKINLAVSIPLSIGAIILSKEIISLIFGASYLAGDLAFKLIMLFCLINSLTRSFETLFYTKHFEKFFLKLLTIASFTNIFLNILIIPFLGIVGAALTTIFSELIIIVMASVFIKKKFKDIVLFRPFFKVMCASLFMAIAMFFIKLLTPTGILHNNFDVLFYVVSGGIFYFIALFIFKIFTKKDLFYFFDMFKKLFN